MTKKIWNDNAVSIIVLPSGEQGKKILDLAQDWSRSWLLTPALWMLADEIPDFDPSQSIDLQVPPDLSAYLLGRDSEQNSVREKVDVFWTLGSQPFNTIRFVAVRTEQDVELMTKTAIRAETAAKFIQSATPQSNDPSRSSETGTNFLKFNLVIAPTNERRLMQGILSQFWDANLVAAAEDRATPQSTDSFVKIEQRFIGFALAHIATTAGIWAGLPISSAEINDEKTQFRMARLQRVFVRGVTSDTLSADVAHWALQKMNFTDTDSSIGLIEGNDVKTIAADYEDPYMNALVDFIMKGPGESDSADNFYYPPYLESPFLEPKISWFKKLLTLIQDMAEGISAIPRWLKGSAEYKLQFAISDIRDEDILYSSVPKRLAPKVKLPPVDVLIASLKPKLPLPTPELWRHLRESISSSIDAPTKTHPKALLDKDGKLLVFGTVDRVLPSPDTQWIGDAFETGTSIKLEPIHWINAQLAHQTATGIQKRIDELAPGIEDAKNQLSETQKLVDETEKEWSVATEDVTLVERELKEDILFSDSLKEGHTHQLPRKISGPSRKAKGTTKKGRS
jgi:hypothetical protein